MKYLLILLLTMPLLAGCASTQTDSQSAKPFVEAQKKSYSFDHISGIPDDLAGPGFEPPEMIGGGEALSEAVNQLAKQRPCPVRGRVSIAYVLDEEGNVIDSAVAEGIDEECDAVAAEAIKLVRFKPAKKNGRAVKIRMATPVTFK